MSVPVQLLFLGTGTSAGVPMIGCHCEVCESTDPRDKRTRPSVCFQYNNVNILVDTSPELRLQCVANPIDVFADEKTHQSLDKCFGYAFVEPDPSSKLFRPHLQRRFIDSAPFEIADQRWTPIPLLHGDMPVLGFRVADVAYCTDVSKIPDASYPLLENLDVLVLDALQKKKHTTHFSLEEAVKEAQRINAKQTWFTHIAHGLSHAATNAELPKNIQLAHDGLTVSSPLATNN